jgi:5-formyltetrahydrofolate cyclo-ligase
MGKQLLPYMSKNSADLLRMRLRSLREAIPVAERQHGNALVCTTLLSWFEARILARLQLEHPEPEVVAGFWPLDGEPDLRPLYAKLHALGITVALPIVVKKQAPLEFHAWGPQDPLSRGAFGVLEPMRREVLHPTVLLVPTLGFTDHGARIGYGGGYYDRTLAQINELGHAFVTIGIAWDQARIEEDAGHRPEEHDYPLDAILTPSGWISEIDPAK